MRRNKLRLIRAFVVAVFMTFLLQCLGASPALAAESQEMYRCYNPNSGEHFYTADATERNHIVSLGWRYEGVGWTAPKSSNSPVYRLYNPNAGEHHYTLSTSERDSLVSLGWKSEGIGWYSDDAKSVPLYRQYNPNQFACNHNYTAKKSESDWLVSLGWRYEGIGWYGVTSQPEKKASFEASNGTIAIKGADGVKTEEGTVISDTSAKLDKSSNVSVGDLIVVNPDDVVNGIALKVTKVTNQGDGMYVEGDVPDMDQVLSSATINDTMDLSNAQVIPAAGVELVENASNDVSVSTMSGTSEFQASGKKSITLKLHGDGKTHFGETTFVFKGDISITMSPEITINADGSLSPDTWVLNSTFEPNATFTCDGEFDGEGDIPLYTLVELPNDGEDDKANCKAGIFAHIDVYGNVSFTCKNYTKAEIVFREGNLNPKISGDDTFIIPNDKSKNELRGAKVGVKESINIKVYNIGIDSYLEAGIGGELDYKQHPDSNPLLYCVDLNPYLYGEYNVDTGLFLTKHFSLDLEDPKTKELPLPKQHLEKVSSTFALVSECMWVDPINLDAEELTLSVGETKQIIATNKIKGGNLDSSVYWKSSDPNIATVDDKGNVRAVSPGETTIVASTAYEHTKSCKVTVSPSHLEKTNALAFVNAYYNNAKLDGPHTNSDGSQYYNVQHIDSWKSDALKYVEKESNAYNELMNSNDGPLGISGVWYVMDKEEIYSSDLTSTPKDVIVNVDYHAGIKNPSSANIYYSDAVDLSFNEDGLITDILVVPYKHHGISPAS